MSSMFAVRRALSPVGRRALSTAPARHALRRAALVPVLRKAPGVMTGALFDRLASSPATTRYVRRTRCRLST